MSAESAEDLVSPPAMAAAAVASNNSSKWKVYLVRYALSVAALAIPMAVTVAVKDHPNLNPVVSASFLIVVSAVAWWAGVWAGILVSVLVVPAITFAATGGKLWLPPHVDPIGVLIFCFISFLVARVANTRRQAEQVLRQSNAELENRIHQRTAELQQANEDVRNRLAEVELLYTQLPVGLCLLDRNLRYIRVNPKFTDIFGGAVSDYVGRPVEDFVSGAVATPIESLCRKVLNTGEPVFGFEWSLLPDDSDTQRTWLIDCCPAKSENGAVTALQVIFHEITERKRFEQLLLRAHAETARREQDLRTLANAMPQICWISNPDGSVAWYNDRWYEYTGIPQGEDRSAPWEAYVAPEVLPNIIQTWKESIERQTGFEIEVPIRSAKGDFRWFLTRTVPARGPSGELSRWFGTSTDIDELKRSREALVASERDLRHANADLQQFAYSASHDLQEPIRTVVVYSQLLARRYGSQLEGEAKTFLTFVCDSAKRMEKLVRDLLEYVQAAHVDDYVSELTNGEEVLRDVLANLTAAIAGAGAEISVDHLPSVRMRRMHLQQVFQNMLGNALKFHGSEQLHIRISAQRGERETVFMVRDNGIGIAPEYHERIFGIFKRLHTAEKYSGTGMGLAICQRIVERYGGRIWVESERGKGSSFFFAIPD